MPGAKSTHEITDTLSEPKINALREWMIYSIIFTSLIILLCGRLIYLALISDVTGICILILVLFVCALVRNAMDVSYIDRQRSLAHQQVKDLIKTNKINMKEASSKRCACWHWCCRPDEKGSLYFIRGNSNLPDM